MKYLPEVKRFLIRLSASLHIITRSYITYGLVRVRNLYCSQYLLLLLLLLL